MNQGGATTTAPTPPRPRLAPLVRELARLAGRSRGEIRQAAERFAEAVWLARESDKARQAAIVYGFEQILFFGDRAPTGPEPGDSE